MAVFLLGALIFLRFVVFTPSVFGSAGTSFVPPVNIGNRGVATFTGHAGPGAVPDLGGADEEKGIADFGKLSDGFVKI